MQQISTAQIRWQCRRGMLELDLIILPFFDEVFSSLSLPEQNIFVELLDYSDPELYSFILGEVPAPAHTVLLIEKIRKYKTAQWTD